MSRSALLLLLALSLAWAPPAAAQEAVCVENATISALRDGLAAGDTSNLSDSTWNAAPILWNQKPNRGQRLWHGLRSAGITRSSSCCVPMAPGRDGSIPVAGPPRESANPVASCIRNRRRDWSLRNSRGDWI